MEATRSILKTLAETSFDSVAGYRKAAEMANSPQLMGILTQQAQKRQSTLDALNQELVRVGGDAVTSGTTAGGLHRLWADITSLFEKGDEAAAERAEEGEDYLLKKFEAALKDQDIDPAARAVIEQAYLEVKEGERLTDQLAHQYD
ncbi:PA2169 family four-helix-bundle protein [Blastomonas sp.]|uniref:PA2169 family four-helix-bundle protein n=1 Tax=Blastomonas sp. TaxID=1909299 RepID=UPI00406AA24C